MKTAVLFGIFFVGYTSAYVPVETFYHENVGIPLAKSIRAAETAKLDSSVQPDNAARIVGGAISPSNAHPYLAGLLITFINAVGTSACGSSLLSANRLVTAAHCWFDGRFQANQFVVVLGSNTLFHGGVRVTTRQVFVHPQWNPTLLNNDVAMIYLPHRVTLNNNIKPIALPNTADLNNLFVGQWAVAAGYGLTSDAQTGISVNQVMSQVNLQVITVQQCMAVFGSNFVRNSNICTNGAGGVGICRGDSGGPLLLNRNGVLTLIGISSFVAQNRCQDGFPSAFARVTSFNNFIRQHL